MIVKEGSDEALSIISFNFSIFFSVFENWKWKDKQSENKSISLFPGLNSLLKKEKDEKNWLYLSSTSISGDFSQSLCLTVR